MDYIDRVSGGRSPVAEHHVLSRDEQYEDALFMGLRRTTGLDLVDVVARYGIDVWERYGVDLRRAVDAGLLVHDAGRRLRLTRAGMLMANEVMAVFIGPPVR
jgi:oxygen-independent coproporphyrinogen-3 oxidase